MSHIIEQNISYHIVIEAKKYLIYDGIDKESEPNSYLELVSFKDELGNDLKIDEYLKLKILHQLQNND